MAAIAEVTSENKRRKGRPTRFSDETLAFLGGLHPEVRSKRGLVDIAYRQRAVALLKDVPECRWLCDFMSMQRGDDRAWQPGVLTELGRIDDDAALVVVARCLCERQPPREEAIRIVRRHRIAPRPAQDDQLAVEIVGVINDYINRYPQTTLTEIHDALALAEVAARCAQEDAEQPPTIEGE